MSIDVTSDARRRARGSRSRDARTGRSEPQNRARSNGQRSSQERPPPPRSDQHESMSRSRASGTRAGGMGRRARRSSLLGGEVHRAAHVNDLTREKNPRGKRRAQSVPGTVLYRTGIMHPPVSFYRYFARVCPGSPRCLFTGILHRMFERT
jgi:hypothetical protein